MTLHVLVVGLGIPISGALVAVLVCLWPTGRTHPVLDLEARPDPDVVPIGAGGERRRSPATRLSSPRHARRAAHFR